MAVADTDPLTLALRRLGRQMTDRFPLDVPAAVVPVTGAAPVGAAPVGVAPVVTPVAPTLAAGPRDYDAQVNAMFPAGAGVARRPFVFPATPAPAAASTRFAADITSGLETPVPASLAAPGFGASVPAAATPSAGNVVVLGNSSDSLTPGSRNFDPVGFRASLRQQQLASAENIAGTEANARLAVANLNAGTELSRADLMGRYGVQERNLANAGALANTRLAGGFDLAGREAAAGAALGAARIKANQDATQAAPEGQLKQLQAQQLQMLLTLARRADEAGASPQVIAGTLRTGQQPNADPLLDATGGVVGLANQGGVQALDPLSSLAAQQELLRQRRLRGQ